MEDPGDEQADVAPRPRCSTPAAAPWGRWADGSVETNWFVLLHRRVTDRAVRSPRYQWWALVALLAGLLSLNITFTVFVVALPTVKADFHTNFSVLAWASTGPLLAFGVAAPFFGKAGDLFGHRRLYQFGLLGAMVSAILTATAPDVGMLLFARALDGVQGAATGTASMAIILELFAPPGPGQGARAGGRWSGPAGPVLGVTLGSPVIQYFGWRTLFWGQLVLLVIASVVVALLLPSDRRARRDDAVADGAAGGGRARRAPSVWEGMDWVGSWSLAGAVTAAMLVLSIGPIVGWTSPGGDRVRASSPSCSASSSSGSETDLRHAARSRRRTGAGATSCSRWGPRRSRASPTSAASSCSRCSWSRSTATACPRSGSSRWPGRSSSPSARRSPGYMTVRTGERNGDALRHRRRCLLSMVLFATLGPSSGLVIILVALALSGLGMGVSMPATSATMSNELAESEYGVMSAAQLLATQVGEVAGIQVVLTIQESIAKQLGPRQRAPQHGAAPQLQRPVLGRRRSWPALAVVCALFIRSAAARGAGRAAGWPTPA